MLGIQGDGSNKMKYFNLLTILLLALSNLSSCVYSQSPQSNSYQYSILPQGKTAKFNEDYMRIHINNSIALRNSRFNDLPISELSGLAWDNDEQLLYAISDEGLLYHFKLSFTKNKLTAANPSLATPLKDAIGYPLKGKYSDSEGLSLINGNNGKKGDSRLIVSFENKPRISLYTPTGKLIKNVKIPKKLRKRKTYRSKNKALESVTLHPQYGILTATEYPIKADDIKHQTLYAVSKKGDKQVWHFKASPAGNSAVTGMETLDDGSILLLERAYQNPITPIIINLRRLDLNDCNSQKECKTETIARFNGADGWLLDNFEGLSHFKDNQYFMVSDNNQNPLQRTLLVHFSIEAKKQYK